MRLIIVSNRLPFTLKKNNGNFKFLKSSGGLVTGVSDYVNSMRDSSFVPLDYIWIGWPGTNVKEGIQKAVRYRALNEYKCLPVFISTREMDHFYQGFCNKTLWPLFHSFTLYAEFTENHWKFYKDVNQRFSEAVLKVLKPDDILWIHDYHLMLLPDLIRKKRPDAAIGFFLHIPFPPYEIFSLLPKKWRTELLRGILGADLVGFHTIDYTQSFLKSVLRILGFDHHLGKIIADNRMIKVDTFPMGIHFKRFNSAATEDKEARKEEEKLNTILKGTKVILSIDRLDYTKGIINRLEGYELFLKENPQWHNKITLLLNVVPSRIGVEHYKEMKIRIDEIVGRINGRFGNVGWTPVQYQYKHLPFEQLVGLYNVADVALVTPLRDGMNLIAKEYIACQSLDNPGVLILSEMAGAAKELVEASIINPNDRREIAWAIKKALEMPLKTRKNRIKSMQKRLEAYDVIRWAGDFISELIDLSEHRTSVKGRFLSSYDKKRLIKDFYSSKPRIIFLDYDGTLVGFKGKPQKAKPDSKILNILNALSELPYTEVVLISGRDKTIMEKWFGELDIYLSAEHGLWIKRRGTNKWEPIRNVSAEWKGEIYSILRRTADRLPHSFIEEKEYSLAFHYRESDPLLASMRVSDLADNLISLTANINVQVLHGEKVLEIRNAEINKGIVVSSLLSQKKYPFILAIGDGTTDEDMFKALPENSYSIKVGFSSSLAKYNVSDYRKVRKLLLDIINVEKSTLELIKT